LNRWAKFVRRCALGLMLMLSVAANCTSESYDPNPYDAIPPVTVNFEYLTPHITTAPARRDDMGNSATAHFERLQQTLFPNTPVFPVFYSDFAAPKVVPVHVPLRR
jgi:hypothetical protein